MQPMLWDAVKKIPPVGQGLLTPGSPDIGATGAGVVAGIGEFYGVGQGG